MGNLDFSTVGYWKIETKLNNRFDFIRVVWFGLKGQNVGSIVSNKYVKASVM